MGTRMHPTLARMKTLLLVALAAIALIAGCATVADETEASALNVNSRYTIESDHVMGLRAEKVSDPIKSELDSLQGEKLDDSRLKRIAERIKHDLHATDVSVSVKRGSVPDHVVVNFEVKKHEQPVDVNLVKFVYHSKEGWSGEGSATTSFGNNSVTFGLVSDGDALVERFTGVRARYERKHLGTDRLRIRFEFDSFHEQWSEATLAAARPFDLYRNRQVFMPEGTLVIAGPVDVSFGLNFARYRPSLPAAKTGSSNAVVTTLRYHQRWGSDQQDQEQDATATYGLQAATRALGADQVYTRHEARAHYRFRRGKESIELGFLAGRIDGTAPLWERFALGNSTTLRGWNKFELDPLGGSRMMHGSVDFRFDRVQVFYDTGAVWDAGQNREQKQSVGVGFCFKRGVQLAVAFPLRAGHIDPVFYAGMNF